MADICATATTRTTDVADDTEPRTNCNGRWEAARREATHAIRLEHRAAPPIGAPAGQMFASTVAGGVLDRPIITAVGRARSLVAGASPPATAAPTNVHVALKCELAPCHSLPLALVTSTAASNRSYTSAVGARNSSPILMRVVSQSTLSSPSTDPCRSSLRIASPTLAPSSLRPVLFSPRLPRRRLFRTQLPSP